MRIRAKKTTIDNITFDSKREGMRYIELKQLQKAGIVRDLRCHTKHQLELAGRPLLIKSEGYPNGRRASYTDDFSYEVREDGGWVKVIEDVKGYDVPLARFRRSVFELLSGLSVSVVR